MELWISACVRVLDIGRQRILRYRRWGLGRWFTEGHVETAGDESVAALGFEKNSYLYLKLGSAGR